MTTYYLDVAEIGGGNNSNDGLSFANRKLTLGGFTLSAGDTVRVKQSPDPTSLGMTATWTNQSATVTLNSALNADVTTCESNWTASANVTCNSNSTFKRQGTNSQQVTFAAGFTTGKAAYFTLASTDYSGYQQLTFWIMTDTALSANVLRLSLCSDTTGDTQVDNFDINFPLVANRWTPVTIDKGSALGASIQSVALYAQSDPGTATIYLDNILTAKASSSADSLSLTSLISKNTGTETWWAIKSIVGTTVTLDQNPTYTTTPQGYSGTTETVTTYKRETLKPAITTGTSQDMPSSGTSGSYITVSGGWDSTNMSTQTGETWIDGRIGDGIGILADTNYVDWDKIAVVRYDVAWRFTGISNTGTIYGANNNGSYGVHCSGATNLNLTSVKGTACNTYGFYSNSGTNASLGNLYNSNSNTTHGILKNNTSTLYITGTVECNNNGSAGISISNGGFRLGTVSTKYNNNHGTQLAQQNDSYIQSLTTTNNAGRGVFLTSTIGDVHIYNYTSSSNSTSSILSSPAGQQNLYIYNASMGEGTKVSFGTTLCDVRVYSQAEGGTFNNNITYTDDAQVTVDTGSPPSVGGLDYKIAITGTSRTQLYPYRFKLGPIAVNSGSVAITAQIKKSHASNISATFICPGGQISGVSSDVSTTVSSTSYATYTLNITPSQKGAVEVYLYVWSDTGSTTDYVQIGNLGAS